MIASYDNKLKLNTTSLFKSTSALLNVKALIMHFIGHLNYFSFSLYTTSNNKDELGRKSEGGCE